MKMTRTVLLKNNVHAKSPRGLFKCIFSSSSSGDGPVCWKFKSTGKNEEHQK